MRQAALAKQHGDLFGGRMRQDRRDPMVILKTSLPEGRSGDALLYEDLKKLEKYLTDWNLSFSQSLCGQIRMGRMLSPKQRNKAMEIVARNRKFIKDR